MDINVETTCCVTGHRDIPPQYMAEVKKRLKNEILEAIRAGYRHFICGFAQGADLLFAQTVVDLKEEYDITLEAAIPYASRMNTSDQTFQNLIQYCDKVIVHSDMFFKGCLMIRNKYMIAASQRVIAIYDGRAKGGTAATINFAAKKNRDIIYIDIPNQHISN